jgi:hypothetical protein
MIISLLYNCKNGHVLYYNRKIEHILKILNIMIFLDFEYNFLNSEYNFFILNIVFMEF